MSVVVVTGSGGGIGRAIVEVLAVDGHRVFATLRDPGVRNAAAADELRAVPGIGDCGVEVVELDVTSTTSVDAAFRAILTAAGRIDVVVNNAGVMCLGVTEAFTADDFARQLDVNLVGPFRVARAVLPHMRERRSGLLVQISSVAGRVAYPLTGLYGASKWGLEALSESLRYELAPSGIDVVLVEPGPFTTEIAANAPTPDLTEYEASYAALLERGEVMQDMFAALFTDADQPTDPRLVGDAVRVLIDTPPGQRPLRTVVGFDYDAVNAINEATEPLRLRALTTFDLGALADVAAAQQLEELEP